MSAAIKFARERRWEVSVRGGAHSTAGHGVCDDGLVIDLSQIRHVSVDPQNARVRVGGGALLADMDAAAQQGGQRNYEPGRSWTHPHVGGLSPARRLTVDSPRERVCGDGLSSCRRLDGGVGER